jgi:hypothetical protein
MAGSTPIRTQPELQSAYTDGIYAAVTAAIKELLESKHAVVVHPSEKLFGALDLIEEVRPSIA